MISRLYRGRIAAAKDWALWNVPGAIRAKEDSGTICVGVKRSDMPLAIQYISRVGGHHVGIPVNVIDDSVFDRV